MIWHVVCRVVALANKMQAIGQPFPDDEPAMRIGDAPRQHLQEFITMTMELPIHATTKGPRDSSVLDIT